MKIKIMPVAKKTVKNGKNIYQCLYDGNEVVKLYSALNYTLMKEYDVDVRFGDIVFDFSRVNPADYGVKK